ncbi:hypothetical protein JHK82_038854 [Glycine max]|uniref:Embryo surrounding factor 1 brassicaceae domain-containing protein n=1 Tax=Glycine max TaxID=3847 RepID=A0A0R0G9N7_SOYBN|nr:uncharacterized protein LOC100527334 precursor [Glycine max]KAG4962164.1 hypothetical protein JHK86_039032 [Glycine max]KAG4964644.1 hypothetical protein JHK85_039619 [Glycine max]KAG5109631.1 hypothetical protein JHK82_038854 [Glycine max]KAG5120922.1 hypothetical protein JHK84_039262 [Glycine max]KAH1093175.1 hypothetical protein GYH30_039080 [Glycine max]|eukprot:XP_014621943.1 uncharacterized protein LOC100527334 isoform X1 [Glycine max]
MSSKKKIAILIPASMLAMLLLISSSEVAASHSKEGEVVKITNEQGDAKFVGGGDLDVMVICFPPPPRYGRGVYYEYVDNLSQKQADKCYCGCCWLTESGDCRQCCREYYWSPRSGGASP